jgi:hypothetical protein
MSFRHYLLINKDGVMGDVGSEKYAKNLKVFMWRKSVFKYFFISIYENLDDFRQTEMSR